MAQATPELPASFSPLVRDWFDGAFPAPTPAQVEAWEAIGNGDNTLVVAPTGSGKTLAAFLSAIDTLVDQPRSTDEPQRRCSVVYISPIKALAVDVERNLRSPLAGIAGKARAAGQTPPDITVAVRSGDTPAADRRAFARHGADILITTPESLFLILTSQARDMLSGVTTVIVDEVHSMAGSKRGAHLAVSLDRLDALLDQPAQRIGLSATVRPVAEAARFLAGGRPVTIAAPPADKQIDVDVVIPVADLTALGEPSDDLTGSTVGEPRRTSIWPHVEERVVDLINAHTSTIVFANSRRLAERLTARLNEIQAERVGAALEQDPAPPAQLMAQSDVAKGASPLLAKAHHGSVSAEQRAIIETELKTGVLPAVVATSSLELGVDMGAVDLVIQVEAPPSVAGGLQRIGRAGHQVGAASHGVMFPKFRGDLLSSAVVAERMRSGSIESLAVTSLPLDVLAQQIVAIIAMDPMTVDELHALLRRSAPFAALSRGPLEAVLDMLSGRYPSEEFAELRPRLTWDRVSGELVARPGAQRIAVTSGGTIPDRGMFGVFLASGEGPGRRVGELDEEMVYESRVGDIFALGASSWRIMDITHDRVLVQPASGLPGRLPFWRGDTLGRPAELGRAHGAFVREVSADPVAARSRLSDIGLDTYAQDNLLTYLEDQQRATGVVPDEKTLVVERFRDEIGDWRVVIHSPYGAGVHAPWALLIAARLRERFGLDVSAMHADDGIVLRLPDIDDELPDLTDLLQADPETLRAEVASLIGGSAVFAARFRECAARALLLPRKQIGSRQPLWQQRLRASSLLEVAAQYPSFPIVAEAVREVLQDVFDVPALIELQQGIAARTVKLVEVQTQAASPFASSLLFDYVAQFLYDGDAPLAERRAAALTVDPELLAELLGGTDGPSLRELLDPEQLLRTERELQRLAEDRRARNADEIADLLRILGPITGADVAERSTLDAAELEQAINTLRATRRLIDVRIADTPRLADPADAGLLRDALGTALPPGIAETFLLTVADPLARLLGRYARTRGPFTAAEAAAHFGIGASVATDALRRLVSSGRLAEGSFRPDGSGRVDQWIERDRDASDRLEPEAPHPGPEFVDAEVLRLLRRRSLAALRQQVEPVAPQALSRFLLEWNGIGGADRRGQAADRLLRAIEQLAGARVPASALESLILPARVPDYSPALLDELMSAGEVLWAGHGSLATDDAWVSLHLADSAHLTLPVPAEDLGGVAHRALLTVLSRGGAYFFPQLAEAARAEHTARRADDADSADAHGDPASGGDRSSSHLSDEVLGAALWDLVLGGVVTGDTFVAARARLQGGKSTHRQPRVAPRLRMGRHSSLARLAAQTRPAKTPPSLGGRWSLLPGAELDPTIRAHAAAEVLLDRHGVVTRGAVVAEDVPGGFGGVYRVLAAFEEAGRVRRGYFVDGLGASQFTTAGAVDRLRSKESAVGSESERVIGPVSIVAAADPANPFGAALRWPDTQGIDEAHRPARRAGAIVAISDGEALFYAERGGRSLLTFSDDADRLNAAAAALADLVRSGRIGGMTVTKIDGQDAIGPDARGPMLDALLANGFSRTPRGLRLRAGVR